MQKNLRVKENFIAFYTILIREIVRFMRIWVQTLLPPVITTTLYFIIFGNLIGSRIGEMDGFSYMQFIAPGLIMMQVITNSYANVATSLYSMKFQHSIEEILITPVPNWLVLLGFSLGGVLRGLMVGLVVTVVALFFTHLSIHHIFVTFLVFALSAFLFALAGFMNALYANSFDTVSIIPTFIITPLTYLGGVFYSLSVLPTFWQSISKANPVVYMISAFRYGILGISDINIPFAVIVICLFTIGLFICNLMLLNRGKGIRD